MAAWSTTPARSVCFYGQMKCSKARRQDNGDIPEVLG